MTDESMADQATQIQKIAVIGAGVMGAGIAAHAANAGAEVLLIDIVPDGADDRNKLAKQAIDKLTKTNPAPLMHPDFAKRITPGNLSDDLDKLADVDWVVEAVIERLDIKQDVYQKIDDHRRPGTIVSSNTSTIPLAKLVDGMEDGFKRDFLITHFFNPPRYMRLLELVAGPDTRMEIIDQIRDYADRAMGKGVVTCHDTPGFIANRIGTFWIQKAFNETLDRELNIQIADMVMGKPMGAPKTGVFALMDLVGLDLMPHLAESLLNNLPADDRYAQIYRESDLVNELIETGYTGRKGKGGFYRLNREGGKKVKEAIDLSTGEYAPAQKPKLAAITAAKSDGLKGLITHDSDAGRFAKAVLVETLGYAAGLVGEVADDILAIDRAMKLGFNWQAGPFEMIDQIGANWLVNQLEDHDDMAPSDILKTAAEKDGFYTVMDGRRHYLTTDGEYRAVERPAGITVLRDIKLGADPLINTGSAKVWDIGDGVVCLEFTSKMNAIDTQIFEAIDQVIDLIDGSDDYLGLVIHNEANNFSVGANIGLALFALNVGLYGQVEQLIEQGQDTYQRLLQADFPVIGAPSGMALGGGCEVLLHCDKVIAHAETYMGLVEVGVGIVPGWGGCARLLERMYQCQNTDNDTVKNGPMAPVMAAFETISLAHVAKSAHLAREKYFIHPERDIIVMNRDRLLAQTKGEVLAMAPDYTPVEETEFPLPGPSGYVALKMAIDDYHRSGKATDHDVTVGNALARVLSGGDTDMIHPKHPDHIRKLEREVFMQLVRNDKTLARMEHMLENGKPLRN